MKHSVRKLHPLVFLSIGTLIWAACALAVALAAEAPTPAPTPPPFVWWEAESPRATDFPPADQCPFKPLNEKEADVLSGGKWIGVDSNVPAGAFLEYDVEVLAAGDYNFWVRKFWLHGPFRWRFDAADWHECGKDVTLADSVEVRETVVANWVALGKATLAVGRHALRIETTTAGAAVFDCFVLTTGVFQPRGRLKPGEPSAPAIEGWFSFEPTHDDFRQTAIDLRFLNHKTAGEFGPLKAQVDHFVFEKEGKPVRFWGVTSGSNTFMLDPESMDYLARRLAKMGVNMVRMHLDFDDDQPNAKLDHIQRFVAALKKEGIYSYLGFYCLAGAAAKPKWNVEGLKEGDRPMSTLFCYPPMQECYKRWARCLFGTPNPYAAGVPLGKDPAVAGIELVDEDNYFFWTFKPYSTIPAVARPFLEKAFGDWAVKKYGSVQKALDTWGPDKAPADSKDDPAAGRIALYDVGTLTGNDWAVAARNEKRACDQAQYLTENLRGFWGDTAKWFRDELGFQGVVVSTNWKTADDRVLGPLDDYTNMAGDSLARNNYFGGDAKGPKSGYSYANGYTYRDRTALRAPEGVSVFQQIQYVDKPFLWTEGAWVMPDRFRTEMPLLVSGYYAMQGVDGLMLFVLERDWAGTLPKWPVQTPAIMGQFPAAALIYRQGLVREAPAMVREDLNLADLYALKGAAVTRPMGLDEGRMKDVPAGAPQQPAKADAVDPLAFYTGRYVRSIGNGPARLVVAPDMAKLIDRQKKTVKSVTGELTLDWGRGLLTVNAPAAQGVTGFLRDAGEVKLGDATISSANEYGAIVLVALDGLPLRTSARMLLQVMTEEQNTGWKVGPKAQDAAAAPAPPAAGAKVDDVVEMEILDVGKPPLIVRKFEGVVKLTRPDAAQLKVRALDINGYPVRDLGAAGSIQLEPTTMYYLIEK